MAAIVRVVQVNTTVHCTVMLRETHGFFSAHQAVILEALFHKILGKMTNWLQSSAKYDKNVKQNHDLIAPQVSSNQFNSKKNSLTGCKTKPVAFIESRFLVRIYGQNKGEIFEGFFPSKMLLVHFWQWETKWCLLPQLEPDLDGPKRQKEDWFYIWRRTGLRQSMTLWRPGNTVVSSPPDPGVAGRLLEPEISANTYIVGH